VWKERKCRKIEAAGVMGRCKSESGRVWEEVGGVKVEFAVER